MENRFSKGLKKGNEIINAGKENNSIPTSLEQWSDEKTNEEIITIESPNYPNVGPDYTKKDPNFSLEAVTSEILLLKYQTALSMIEIGKRLHYVKNNLEHGKWGQWLKEQAVISQRMANYYMKAANEFSNSQAIANLSKTKVISLLEMPGNLREEFLNEPQQLPTGEIKTIDEMTTRELDDAIKAKIEAEKAQKEAEQRAQEAIKKAEEAEKIAKNAINDKEAVLREKESIEIAFKELKEKPPEITAAEPEDYQSTKEEVQRLQQELDRLKNNPTTIEKPLIPDDYESLKLEVDRLKQEIEFLADNSSPINEITEDEINTTLNSLSRFIDDFEYRAGEIKKLKSVSQNESITIQITEIIEKLKKSIAELESVID